MNFTLSHPKLGFWDIETVSYPSRDSKTGMKVVYQKANFISFIFESAYGEFDRMFVLDINFFFNYTSQISISSFFSIFADKELDFSNEQLYQPKKFSYDYYVDTESREKWYNKHWIPIDVDIESIRSEDDAMGQFVHFLSQHLQFQSYVLLAHNR